MEKYNRAVRRHHIARLKAKRKNYWGHNTNWCGPMEPSQLGKVVQYPQACSCLGCGNSRKYEGRPLRELCDFITLKEEVHHVVTLLGATDEQNDPSHQGQSRLEP